jgi:tRNA nucleotidyltransferase (CCA-adding enzyme)
MKIYLVGGAVRDQLLGLKVKDKDWVVVGATPTEMLQLNYAQVGADFPVFLHPSTKEEYALARTERKKGHGYQGFECHTSPEVSLEDDLLRRDLTINAMATGPENKIIDPYNGQADIKSKTLRHVSQAFTEDPLRILRVARFAARFEPLGFHIASETLRLMQTMEESGETKHLVAERVWQETERALREDSAWIYFETLQKVGSLLTLFPEIDALFGIPQPPKYHPEIDCGIHSLMSLKAACRLSKDSDVRFASLIHDLGKALSPKDNLPHHYGHEKKGLKPIKKLCRRLKAPHNYSELAQLVSEFHTHIHKVTELKSSTILKVLKQCDAFRRPDRFKKVLLCCEADARGRTGFEETDYPQANLFLQALKHAQLVSAKSLIEQGIILPDTPGKEIGNQIDLERNLRIKSFFNHLP